MLTSDRPAVARHGVRRPAQLRGWAASLVTALCVAFLVANTNLAELGRALQHVDYGQLLGGLALSALTVALKGLRWRALYPLWARPSASLAIAGLAAGQVANWAAPLRVGEAVRVGLVARPGAADGSRSLAAGIGVLVIEKVLDSALLLVTLAALVVLVGVPEWLSRPAVLVAVVGATVVLGGAVRLRRATPSQWLVTVRGWLARWPATRAAWLLDGAAALGEGLSAWLTPGRAVEAIGFSVLAWGLGAATNYVVFKSIDVAPTHMLGATLAILAALYGAAVVPTLPGRLGVFQYVCIVTLAPFGVGLSDAVAFSVALYVVVYGPPLLIGLGARVLMGQPAARRADTGAR